MAAGGRFYSDAVVPVADDDAHTVDGLRATDLTKAAQVVNTAIVDDWDGSTLDQDLAFTAPVDGALLVTAKSVAGSDANETGSGRSDVFNTLRLDGTAVTPFEPRKVTIDFDATAGAHTITSRLTGPGGTRFVFVYGREMTVIFAPFGKTTSSPGSGPFGRVPRRSSLPDLRSDAEGSATMPSAGAATQSGPSGGAYSVALPASFHALKPPSRWATRS